MESDMVNYQKRYLAISWNTISSLIIARKTWNCSFFCTFSPVPKRYPKRYLSDTLLVHKCSLIHPVPRNQKETKSSRKKELKAQKAMNTVVTVPFITISYVYAPNTVKRYSELRKTIPMSHRAPQLYWVLLASHVCFMSNGLEILVRFLSRAELGRTATYQPNKRCCRWEVFWKKAIWMRRSKKPQNGVFQNKRHWMELSSLAVDTWCPVVGQVCEPGCSFRSAAATSNQAWKRRSNQSGIG